MSTDLHASDPTGVILVVLFSWTRTDWNWGWLSVTRVASGRVVVFACLRVAQSDCVLWLLWNSLRWLWRYKELASSWSCRGSFLNRKTNSLSLPDLQTDTLHHICVGWKMLWIKAITGGEALQGSSWARCHIKSRAMLAVVLSVQLCPNYPFCSVPLAWTHVYVWRKLIVIGGTQK